MDYKRIIPSRRLRLKLLSLLDWVPDALMVRVQYRLATGRWPNLRQPERFTEKLQWYKLHWRDPLMERCADKYEVRDYVRSCGLGHLLNECYGVFGSPEELDFAALPERFVLKDTLGGGGNEILFVRKSDACDEAALRECLASWGKRSPAAKNCGREWVYEGRPHRILAERWLEPDGEEGLAEYKLFCFNGRVSFLYVQDSRILGHSVPTGIFLPDGRKLSVRVKRQPECRRGFVSPELLGELIRCAEQLAAPFPHVRVDFLYAQGRITFGELTFFEGSGYTCFEPDAFDFEAGRMFVLPPGRV
ncbi:ATP-grasp fold amidoligase family protein [Mailhella sp.]|uniref:ATP-grasp fold amidoligase family protein n=1 Tax=Mailhella sp. TaxID=1981029 RepID=UPI0040632FF2